MKRFMLMLIVLATVTVLMKSTSSAGESNGQDTCTLKTIKGTYLFQAQGAVLSEGVARPYAEAGIWTLDGKGNAAGVISGSIGGVPFATADAFTATYALKSDCVYAVVDQFGLKLELYTTPSAKTMTYASPGFSRTQVRQ